jgi:hypothetical protein
MEKDYLQDISTRIDDKSEVDNKNYLSDRNKVCDNTIGMVLPRNDTPSHTDLNSREERDVTPQSPLELLKAPCSCQAKAQSLRTPSCPFVPYLYPSPTPHQQRILTGA